MTTTTSQHASAPPPRRRLPRTVTLMLTAALAAGTASAALAGTSAAATTAKTPASPAGPARYWDDPGGPWDGSGGTWGGSGGMWGGVGGPWAAGRAWGAADGTWDGPAPASSGRTEYFHVASVNQAGPGAIIVTGAFTDGGTEHPGRAVDQAVFTGGSFRIDHAAGHPTVRFNPKTCLGTITQTGPFRVYDGTGRFAGLEGSGTYQFSAAYTTTRNATGCAKTMTAYIETINGTATLSPAAARSIAAKTT